jgi:hypothetical protein
VLISPAKNPGYFSTFGLLDDVEDLFGLSSSGQSETVNVCFSWLVRGLS